VNDQTKHREDQSIQHWPSFIPTTETDTGMNSLQYNRKILDDLLGGQTEQDIDTLCMEYCGRFIDLSNLVSTQSKRTVTAAKIRPTFKAPTKPVKHMYPSKLNVQAIETLDAQSVLDKAPLSRNNSCDSTISSSSNTVAYTQNKHKKDSKTSTSSGSYHFQRLTCSSAHSISEKKGNFRALSRENSGVGAVRVLPGGDCESILKTSRGVGRSRSAHTCKTTFLSPIKRSPVGTLSRRGMQRTRSNDGHDLPAAPIHCDPHRHTPRHGHKKKNKSTIEISPGVYETIRGSDETLEAIECGNVTITDCLVCNACLVTLQDAHYVLCPDCKVVSPIVLGDGDSSHDHTRRHYYPNQEARPEEGGVGLGVHAASAGYIVDSDYMDQQPIIHIDNTYQQRYTNNIAYDIDNDLDLDDPYFYDQPLTHGQRILTLR
jgi:hypothetical protein